MFEDLTRARAVITGGASGIGLALARDLAGRGTTVTIVDISDDNLAAASEGLSADGLHVSTFRADVSSLADVERLKTETDRLHGGTDLLFNNAGVAYNAKPLWETPAEIVEWIYAVNVTGVINGLRVFIPDMIANGRGHIVNTASIGGFHVHTGEGIHLGLYASTKYAVVALSEGLRYDLEPHGVGVSVLAPGSVATGIALSGRTRQDRFGGPAAGSPQGEMVRMQTDAGLDPSVVAGMVISAIEADRLYVFTHEANRGPLEQRHAAILQGFDTAPFLA